MVRHGGALVSRSERNMSPEHSFLPRANPKPGNVRVRAKTRTKKEVRIEDP